MTQAFELEKKCSWPSWGIDPGRAIPSVHRPLTIRQSGYWQANLQGLFLSAPLMSSRSPENPGSVQTRCYPPTFFRLPALSCPNIRECPFHLACFCVAQPVCNARLGVSFASMALRQVCVDLLACSFREWRRRSRSKFQIVAVTAYRPSVGP